jgi:hypothetical protein
MRDRGHTALSTQTFEQPLSHDWPALFAQTVLLMPSQCPQTVKTGSRGLNSGVLVSQLKDRSCAQRDHNTEKCLLVREGLGVGVVCGMGHRGQLMGPFVEE